MFKPLYSQFPTQFRKTDGSINCKFVSYQHKFKLDLEVNLTDPETCSGCPFEHNSTCRHLGDDLPRNQTPIPGGAYHWIGRHKDCPLTQIGGPYCGDMPNDS